VRGQFDCRHCDQSAALTPQLYSQLESACKVIINKSRDCQRQGTAWHALPEDLPRFEFRIKGCPELNIKDGTFTAPLVFARPTAELEYPVDAPDEDRDPKQFFWMPFTEPGLVERLGDVTWSLKIDVDTSIPDTRYDRPFYTGLLSKARRRCFQWRGPKANPQCEFPGYRAHLEDHLAKVDDPEWRRTQSSNPCTSFFERAYAGELVFLCSPGCTWPRSESYRLAIRVTLGQDSVFAIEGFLVEPSWLADLAEAEYKTLLASKQLGLVLDLDQTLIFNLGRDHCRGVPWYRDLRVRRGEDAAEQERRNRIREADKAGSLKYLETGIQIATRKGVSEMLKSLTKKYQLHVLCNGSRSYARQVIRACGWDPYFREGAKHRIVSSMWTRPAGGGPTASTGRKDFRNIFSFYRYREWQGVVAALDDNEQVWLDSLNSAADRSRQRENETICIIQNAKYQGHSRGTTIPTMRSIFDRTHQTFFDNLEANKNPPVLASRNATAPAKPVLLRHITREIMAAPSQESESGVTENGT